MTNILELLQAERAKIDSAILALNGGSATKRRGRPPGSSKKSASIADATINHTHRKRTAAQKAAQSAAMKANWAKRKRAVKAEKSAKSK